MGRRPHPVWADTESTQQSAAWHVQAADWVRVHAPDGSYAARRAAAALHEAERAAEALARLLEPGPQARGQPLDIFLVDPIAGSAEDVVDPAGSGAALLRVVQPDAPSEPLVRELTRALVSRWLGPRAAVSPLVDGLAGVVSARIGVGPPSREADDRVRLELAAGRPVAPLTPPASAGADDAPLNS